MDAVYDSILFLPCFISLFWAVTLLYDRKTNSKPQNVWIFFLVNMNLCSVVWGILFGGVEDYSVYYKLDVIDLVFTLQVFPLIYFFFRSLISSRNFTWKQYIWLLPGFVLGAGSGALYALMGEEQSVGFIRELVDNPIGSHFETGSLPWWNYLISVYMFVVVLFFQIVGVMIYSTVSLIRYRKGLVNLFSNLEEKSLENSKAVLIGLFILLGIGVIVECMWGWNYDCYYFIRHLLIIATAAVIYYMSYHVSKLRFTAENMDEENEPEENEESVPVDKVDLTDESYTNAAEQSKTYERVLWQLNRLMDEDQLFLQANISLNDIARLINSNRTYISNVINSEFRCTFHDYINDKRIEFAQKQTIQNPALSHEQIAKTSGFTHASSFSRTFKRQTGITFREWQKSISQ